MQRIDCYMVDAEIGAISGFKYVILSTQRWLNIGFVLTE